MERQWNEIVLENDDADEAFARAAPLLVEALQLVEAAQAVHGTVRLANRVMLTRKSEHARRTSAPNSNSNCSEDGGPFFPFGWSMSSADGSGGEGQAHVSDEFPRRPSVRLSSSFDPRGAVEATQEEMLGPYLDAILTSFAPLQRQRQHETPSFPSSASAPSSLRKESEEGRRSQAHAAPLLVECRSDGLIAPRGLQLQDTLLSQPIFRYAAFQASFERLSTIASTPLLFTACEPRLKVLESTFALYRAYNGSREDSYHPLFGGGDVKLAPKVDIRRLETSMSARALLAFMEEMRRTQPDYRVNKLDESTHAGTSELTMQHVFDRFFGAETSAAAAAHGGAGRRRRELPVTTESLCLRPNYAKGGGASSGVVDVDYLHSSCPVVYRDADGTGTDADLACTAIVEGSGEQKGLAAPNATAAAVSPAWSSWSSSSGNGSGNGSNVSSRVQHAGRLLQYFLNLHSVNQGDLLAKLLAPLVRDVVETSGTGLDALELELTVTGRDRGELGRIAEWCVKSGLLGDDEDEEEEEAERSSPQGRGGGGPARRRPPQVQFCLRVTQGAYTAAAASASTGMSEASFLGCGAGDEGSGAARGGSSVSVSQVVGHLLGDTPYARFVAEEIARQGGNGGGAPPSTTPPQGFADVLANIFVPIWETLLREDGNRGSSDGQRNSRESRRRRGDHVARLLRRVVAFSVQLGNGGGEEGGADAGDSDEGVGTDRSMGRSSTAFGRRYPLCPATPPPDSLFVFHVRRNVELLNCFTCAHEYFYAQHCIDASDEASVFSYFVPSHSLYHTGPPLLPGPLRFRIDSSVSASHASASSGSRGGGIGGMGGHVRRAGGGIAGRLLNDEQDGGGEEGDVPSPTAGEAVVAPLAAGASDVRAALTESVLGLLLADEIVNPAHLFEWGPVAYLYYLTQRHIVLTPSKNRVTGASAGVGGNGSGGTSAIADLAASGASSVPSSSAAAGVGGSGSGSGGGPSSSSAAALANAIPYAIAHGLHASLATMDPLLFDSSDQALQEELEDTVKHFGLAMTDVTEMCLRSVESRGNIGLSSWGPWAGWAGRGKDDSTSSSQDQGTGAGPPVCGWDVGEGQRRVFGTAWPYARARCNEFSTTQVNSLRIRQRNRSLRHELELVCRKGLPQQQQQQQKAARSGRPLPSSGQAREEEELLLAANTTLSSGNGLSLRTRRRRLFAILGIRTADNTDGTDDTPAFEAASNGRQANNSNNNNLRADAVVAMDGRERRLLSVARRPSRYRHTESAMLFPRIVITGPTSTEPSAMAKAVVRCIALREFYRQFVVREPAGVEPRKDANEPVEVSYTIKDGVIDVHTSLSTTTAKPSSPAPTTAEEREERGQDRAVFPPLPTWMRFQADVRQLRALASNGSLRQYTQRRLDMLEGKYRLHVGLTNDDEEPYYVIVDEGADGEIATTYRRYAPRHRSGGAREEQQQPPERTGRQRRVVLRKRQDRKGDLYNCVKVDNHCHAASGVTATCLLQYIRRKVRDHPDDIVGVDRKTGKPTTLAGMFEGVMATHPQLFVAEQHSSHNAREGGTTVEAPQAVLGRLTIAALDVQAARATFNRFDDFNSRFSPMRMAAMRSLFLKTDNFMGGRYFAELIQEGIFDKQAKEGNTFSEYRLSIYGRDRGEWDRLARWFALNGMSHRTNRWMIQVPRLFSLYKRMGIVDNFAQMLTNIFAPLWDASMHPEKHPFVDHFLQHVSGFDSVDDESDRESDEVIRVPPQLWTRKANPPYAYYMFHMWANITTLNRFRASRGLSTFDFRPHAGESGDPDHMADAFFVADGISHGINLAKRPVLQYLYYLAQIPLSIVPLSNNALFCKYADNPFPHFLRRGLNVSLSTDGALVFHATEQPLLEEYSTARNVWGLSSADLCEIAKNSVAMSGYPRARKEQWLGPLFALSSVLGNDVARSNVPLTRTAFRYESYFEEVSYLEARAAMELPTRAMRSPLEEEGYLLDLVATKARVQATSAAATTDSSEQKAPSPSFAPSRMQLLARKLSGGSQDISVLLFAPAAGAEGKERKGTPWTYSPL